MIKIINYRAGNAPSVMHAVTKLGYPAEFAFGKKDLQKASHIILPGVGSAKATIESLVELDLIETLWDLVLNKKVPFLGICVGLQILFEHSEEENTECFGWLKGRVVKFDTSRVRVPQMGWNKVSFNKETPILTNDDYFYFVNSYYAIPSDPSIIWGVAEYGDTFTAAVHKGNIFATQFHVEKSGEAGLKLLDGFLRLKREDIPC